VLTKSLSKPHPDERHDIQHSIRLWFVSPVFWPFSLRAASSRAVVADMHRLQVNCRLAEVSPRKWLTAMGTARRYFSGRLRHRFLGNDISNRVSDQKSVNRFPGPIAYTIQIEAKLVHCTRRIRWV
jgi:hypothetical protein